MTKQHLLAYTTVALMFGAMGAYAQNKQAAPLTGTPAPGATAGVQALLAQTLPDAAGKPQALAQFKGKAMLVNFWAPWCGPCVKEMPELSALQKEAIGKKIQVIGIGIDSPSNIAEFTKKLSITYPIYVAGMSGTDLARQFGNVNGGLPYTVLIGADGQVKKTYLGGLKFPQLRADLATL